MACHPHHSILGGGFGRAPLAHLQVSDGPHEDPVSAPVQAMAGAHHPARHLSARVAAGCERMAADAYTHRMAADHEEAAGHAAHEEGGGHEEGGAHSFQTAHNRHVSSACHVSSARSWHEHKKAPIPLGTHKKAVHHYVHHQA